MLTCGRAVSTAGPASPETPQRSVTHHGGRQSRICDSWRRCHRLHHRRPLGAIRAHGPHAGPRTAGSGNRTPRASHQRAGGDFATGTGVDRCVRIQRRRCLIVGTKTYGTEAALAPLLHAQIGTAFSIQNGLMKNDQLAAAWGRERVLGALADTSGELLPTGETLFTRNEQLYIGELTGAESARARRIAGIIDGSGVRTSAVSDIESLEWSKFAAWAGLMVLSVTTRAVTWKYLVDPDSALVLARLVREMGTLAAARKIPLSDRSPLPVASIAGVAEGEA